MIHLSVETAPSERYSLDEQDRQILAHLRFHARDSYREIAKKLKLHPATVIKRVGRMEKAGIITCFGANVNYLALGYEFMALVGISTIHGHLVEVEEKLRAFPGIVAVFDLTGEIDAMALVACKNRTDFNRTIKRLLSTPYIEHTNTHIILNVVKSEWEFVPQ